MRLTRRVGPNEAETPANSREADGTREVVEPSRPLSSGRREPVEADRTAPERRRRRLAWRTRNAGAAAVGTAGAGVVLLARLVMAAASVIAMLIALAIVLRDVDSNGANTIVKGIH